MESTLSPSRRSPPAAPETGASPAQSQSFLSRVRRQLLAVDVCIVGFLAMMIAWALLGMVVPAARLYPYDSRYSWAEIPAWTLVLKLSGILAVYLIAQRFGVYYHRNYASTGRKAPLWLASANIAYVFIPVLLLPLVFNLLGAFISGVSGVPTIEAHPAYDPGANYDRAATYWDIWLKDLDVTMTGVYPAAWLRQFQAPWSTGLMLLCYLAYYVSPLVAVLPQILKRKWRRVRRITGIYAGALVTTYVGYILIPATGPRFEGGFKAWMPEQPGWFATEFWQTTLDNAEVIRWDAFPSGHVAIAIVAFVLALRHHRKVGLAYLPFVIGLPLATVFLGYHYLTDVVFGFVFAIGTFLVLEPAVRWWESAWHVPEETEKPAL